MSIFLIIGIIISPALQGERNSCETMRGEHLANKLHSKKNNTHLKAGMRNETNMVC